MKKPIISSYWDELNQFEGLVNFYSNDDFEKFLFNYTLVLLCITVSTVMLKVCIKTRKLNIGLGTFKPVKEKTYYYT